MQSGQTEATSHHLCNAAISGSAIHSARQRRRKQYERIEKELECLHNEQLQRLKDGGEMADVERSTSLRGDKKYSRNKGLRSGQSSPSPEFPSLLPLSGGKLFTVACEVVGNE